MAEGHPLVNTLQLHACYRHIRMATFALPPADARRGCFRLQGGRAHIDPAAAAVPSATSRAEPLPAEPPATAVARMYLHERKALVLCASAAQGARCPLVSSHRLSSFLRAGRREVCRTREIHPD